MFKKFRFNIYIPRGRMWIDGKENQGLRVGKWKMERGFKGPSRTSGTNDWR
jgi:hypothetical protein